MSAVGRVFSQELRKTFQVFKTFVAKDSRALSTTLTTNAETSNATSTEARKALVNELKAKHDAGDLVPPQFRFIYPEFLPDPNPELRNRLRERLERMDMMARRSVIDIPEFYVGSILSVIYAEPHAPGKSNKFLGICIQKSGCGVRASFILRNVIDNQGVEVVFDMYDPAIQEINCLRLEKRLDSHLLYLRDSPAEYSTFPLTMEAELLAEGSPVPVNPLQVTLKEKPWVQKWERQGLKGVKDLYVTRRQYKKAIAAQKPWEKYDLMKIYRETIPAEEQKQIFSEIYSELHNLEITRRKMKRKRGFIRPQKTA